MNREERGILYGMAFGDGYIRCSDRVKPEGYKWTASELCVAHSTKQYEYAQHKAELIHSIFGGNKPKLHPTKTTLKVHGADKTYTGVRFTKSNPYFRQMHRVLYATGKKMFTEQALGYLTDHGLALWFMDDGSMNCNKNKAGEITSLHGTICTQCSEEEAKMIVDFLTYQYGIPAKLRKNKGRYDIGFATKACHKLADVIQPYMIPSMMYKLRHLEDFVLRTSARHPDFDMRDDDIVRPYGKENRKK